LWALVPPRSDRLERADLRAKDHQLWHELGRHLLVVSDRRGGLLGEGLASSFEARSEEIKQILIGAVATREVMHEHHLHIRSGENRLADLEALARSHLKSDRAELGCDQHSA
jgi:hypothetical protein